MDSSKRPAKDETTRVDIVHNGRIVLPSDFKLDLGQEMTTLRELFKQMKRGTRRAKLRQAFGLTSKTWPGLGINKSGPIGR